MELEAYKLAIINGIRKTENLIPLSNQRIYKVAKGIYGFKCEGCNGYHTIWTSEALNHAPCPVWGFNGNFQLPTITPSVLNTWGKLADPNWTEPDEPASEDWSWSGRCHIFVTNGQIQWLGDCTHKLAAQTRMLPFIREDLVEKDI